MREPDLNNIKKHLSELVCERNPFTTPDSLVRAGEYIRQQLQSVNLAVREETVPFEGMQSMNILGLKQGTAPSSGTFVLAAHYDTVEGSPGADDNASAVSALLETARCLEDSQFEKSLLFAGFTLEEYGFVGSHHFLKQRQNEVAPFSGMISLEMVGFCNPEAGSQKYPPYVDATQYPDSGDFIAVVGNEPSATLAHSLASVMDQSVPPLTVEKLVVPGRGDQFREVTLSDHFPFWENNIPAVMVTDTAFLRNPNYHQPSDTLDTLDIDFIGHVTKGICNFLETHLGAPRKIQFESGANPLS
jgi:Zn-dependent M28 family amino/carboxypeptidase